MAANRTTVSWAVSLANAPQWLLCRTWFGPG